MTEGGKYRLIYMKEGRKDRGMDGWMDMKEEWVDGYEKWKYEE